jgi:hypothetical protein
MPDAMTTRLRFRRPGGAALVIDACALATMLR